MLYIILLLLTECEYWEFIMSTYGTQAVLARIRRFFLMYLQRVINAYK